MQQFIIGSNDCGQRLDKFVLKVFPMLSKSTLYKALRKKNIKRNGKRCYGNDILKINDVLRIYLPDSVLKKQPERTINYSALPVDIVYQDDHLLILNKPVGLKSQPDQAGEDSLIGRALYYLASHKLYDPQTEHSFCPALCNRLDRNTSGLIIVAKNATALRVINQMLAQSRIRKTYICKVHGIPKPSHAVLQGWWTKDSKQNKATITQYQRPNSKKVITEYDLLNYDKDSCNLQVTLHTGRSHQIRAHLALIHHPLIGDQKYGSSQQPPYSLTAYSLAFHCNERDHPLQYLNGQIICLPEKL